MTDLGRGLRCGGSRFSARCGAERLRAEGVVAGLQEGVEAALAAGGVEVRYIGAVG